MDELTIEYYRSNAQSLATAYEAVMSPVQQYFQLAFLKGGRVLDIGSGSGRDLAALRNAGYDAYGIEPAPELVAESQKLHPELEGRIRDGGLPDLKGEGDSTYDGILCSAVLMHLPESKLFDSAFAIRRILKQHGRLLISVPNQRDDVGEGSRDSKGRLFTPLPIGQMQLLFERLGFQSIGQWRSADALGRGHTWNTLLLELRVGSQLRPVDQIEGILNRDKKVATYKLALFRAISDIALQQPHIAKWMPEGVGIDIGAVAERWITYYWPIVGNSKYIPQINGERPGCQKPVKFRESLKRLVDRYRRSGGYSSFAVAYGSGQLSADQLVKRVLTEISQTIRTGPVQFAGGSLSEGRVFSYRDRLIIMPAEIWREFCLMGHWISDAVILRWAELSMRLGKHLAIAAEDVTGLLLAQSENSRETEQARAVYFAWDDRECVWTGRKLRDEFEVDHVIPYSLWRNNQLWNLLPASKEANRRKSDQIPSTALLYKRRDAIVSCWRVMRRELPERFGSETLRFLGSASPSWELDLFARLKESAELTAMQRGVARWEGSS